MQYLHVLQPKSKLGFNVPFNSQGHIGTGPQHCHLWDSNSMYYRMLFDPSDCTSTAPFVKLLTFPNWKTEAQGWPFINVVEVLYPAGEDRTKWLNTAILRGHPSNYVSTSTWGWAYILCVPMWVCYPLVQILERLLIKIYKVINIFTISKFKWLNWQTNRRLLKERRKLLDYFITALWFVNF